MESCNPWAEKRARRECKSDGRNKQGKEDNESVYIKEREREPTTFHVTLDFRVSLLSSLGSRYSVHDVQSSRAPMIRRDLRTRLVVRSRSNNLLAI